MHSLKKVSTAGKKRKKKDEAVKTATNGANGTAHAQTATPRTSTSMDGNTDSEGPAGINNAATASLTAKVMEEQERAKKRKLENENVRSLFSSRDQSKPIGRSSDFMTRGYSVPSGGKR